MQFIEVEKSIKEKEWSMTDLHSHNHYEIYFLMTGVRSFFIDNQMYKIAAPCLIIIPPYTMHKTEGDSFSRININITQNTLNSFETNIVEKLSKKIIPLTNETSKTLFPYLEEAATISSNDEKFLTDKLKIITSFVIYQISKINFSNDYLPTTAKSENVSPLTLKIIDYINNNYNENITLTSLSKKFYLSKVSICSIFKKAMNCTIVEYLMRLRLNKAKQYLSSSNKNIEEISSLCGFSSAAYMGLIFKQKVGLSPLQYRKLQNDKQ